MQYAPTRGNGIHGDRMTHKTHTSTPTQRTSRFLARLPSPPPPSRKKPTSQRGQAAEDIAAFWLEQRQIYTLQRNVHTRWGEIDLIAQDGDTLVFFEIRLRAAHDTTAAILSVTPAKQQRITQTAHTFLARYPSWTNAPQRFDILAIALLPDQSLLFSHLRAAFDASTHARYHY